ncbi:MAG: DUF1349 domain-containing protein [Caldilineaceae bacterium]|nr:DUF1349 domain-containing protein [Caldilineaceae bacterium]
MANHPILHTTFTAARLHPKLQWFAPPRRWTIGGGSLTIYPDGETDFWCKTHYGFEADNGHFLFTEAASDFVLATHVRFQPRHQYDQAGLMVRVSPDCWLKTSVEYESEHEPSKLGVVVTNFGYSDWSTQNYTGQTNTIDLRVRRVGSDYHVEFLDHVSGEWTQLRMAHLHGDEGGPVQCGLYACSPKEGGFVAEFDFLSVVEPAA